MLQKDCWRIFNSEHYPNVLQDYQHVRLLSPNMRLAEAVFNQAQWF